MWRKLSNNRYVKHAHRSAKSIKFIITIVLISADVIGLPADSENITSNFVAVLRLDVTKFPRYRIYVAHSSKYQLRSLRSVWSASAACRSRSSHSFRMHLSASE